MFRCGLIFKKKSENLAVKDPVVQSRANQNYSHGIGTHNVTHCQSQL